MHFLYTFHLSFTPLWGKKVLCGPHLLGRQDKEDWRLSDLSKVKYSVSGWTEIEPQAGWGEYSDIWLISFIWHLVGASCEPLVNESKRLGVNWGSLRFFDVHEVWLTSHLFSHWPPQAAVSQMWKWGHRIILSSETSILSSKQERLKNHWGNSKIPQ